MNETAKGRNGETARKAIRHFRDLEVYQNGLAAGLQIYDLSKRFPSEEREGEAAETQVHLEFACSHCYLPQSDFLKLDDAYEKVIGQIVKMIDQPQKWLIQSCRRRS
jgi:hypothetical protein